jgi:Ulp1 family protease
VRKWTTRVDLFDKDFIIVPVNQSLHWTLAIVCHPGEAARLAARASAGAAAGASAAAAHDVIEVRPHVPLRRHTDCCAHALCPPHKQIDDDPATEDAGGPSPVIIQLNSMSGACCCAVHALCSSVCGVLLT